MSFSLYCAMCMAAALLWISTTRSGFENFRTVKKENERKRNERLAELLLFARSLKRSTKGQGIEL